MSSNDSGGGNDKPDAELYVAVVSLVIALIALLGTVMQVLQQYYASATGFSNCDRRVIGKWHNYKERRFKWKELRFEVRFKAPVVFVCPADNKKGPVPDVVWIIDGSPKSQEDTMTDSIGAQPPPVPVDGTSTLPRFTLRQRPTNSSLKQKITRTVDRDHEKRIHTADNERATWLTMLTEFQRMEMESSSWQDTEYGWHSGRPGQPRIDPPVFADRKLAIAVQAKPRSWDTMPPNIKKPYATTTMCHLVEMAAMLGLHWKEFDRSSDKYRAEGNGYVLTGSHVPDLGVVFNFQISGKCKFGDNRVVPSTHVKEFAFGLVPTVFRTQDDDRRLGSIAEDPRDRGLLLLGSTNEVAETVAWFGCNTRTADILRDDSKKHGHLFPIAFEILGMLSKPLYIPNMSFRMVPNPTVYTWDTKFFNLRRMLDGFRSQLENSEAVTESYSNVATNETAPHLQPLRNKAETVCDALEKQKADRGENEFSLGLCHALFHSIEFCDKYLAGVRPKLVQVVLREHIQEILRMVNSEGEAEKSAIGQLMDAAPEQRHAVFMRVYFDHVLPHVIKTCIQSIRRRDTPMMGLNSPPGSPLASPPVSPESRQRGGNRNLTTEMVTVQVTEIWCTLVFRMMCWLLLHDFHKNDRQISSKSEVWGSRLPVYIC
ncbi:modin [Gaeumannomyces tritici R3-111a-1]|uniref:Modin n=1 Tax=Gaeumannomyces tritici (strain R3-111a-1) TaxID=644352 RepID=J3P5W4_GAET3|nr:modin [Gaeumannomyces tritici R3-111a-1]EJT75066.1 modin [Gaeumannomyces tritici R3-111a-1]